MCEEIRLSWGPLWLQWSIYGALIVFSMFFGQAGAFLAAFVLLVALLGTLQYMFYRWGHKLILCEDRIVWHEGILSRDQTSVLLQDIKVVDVKQDFLQRLFNYGTLKIGTAGTSDYEIVASAIPNPYELRDKIYEMKQGS